MPIFASGGLQIRQNGAGKVLPGPLTPFRVSQNELLINEQEKHT